MTSITTLRPGLLVSLKTSMQGNVRYTTREIEADHLEEDGARKAIWETNRVIEHPREHEEGTQARAKARSLIAGVCSPSSFGLLCPASDGDKLSAAIEAAREVADAFNRRANITRVLVYVIVGRVASDDVEAVRAINSEVRDLLTSMETGLQALDVKVVREAANKARALSAMLSPLAAERAQVAIETARSAARRIVKAGETAALEIDEATLRRIRESRTAFLDYYDGAAQAEVSSPEIVGRAIDLDIEAITTKEVRPAPVSNLEF